MKSTATKTIVISAALVVAVAIVVGVQIWPSSQGGGAANIGGPFELTDQNGQSRTAADFRGELMLVYFGYTYCPDVCPTELHRMGLVLEELGEESKQVRPIFITVDPARDDPERLKEYARNFHPRLVALTGNGGAIKDAAKAYRIYYAKAKDSGEGEDYLMDHSSIIYLMGRDGRYLTHFTASTSIEDMAARIREHVS